ncbi:uncharacterized protein LOC122501739 [Leptopilina heterotoma]|uniref:uncharacterized protein LOC122501739 n=1 Tax=Leptopilina heterotoma TaxID=63436 RepID=UPI001CA7D223|nr:uncharacterized protein LOC122501739 [Leptopilina heterotoma]
MAAELARFCEMKILESEANIIAFIKKTKRNLQFDSTHNLKQMTTLLANNNYHNQNTVNVEIEKRTEITAILQETFPINDDVKFLKFEESLHPTNLGARDNNGQIIEYSSVQKQKALVSLFSVWISANDTWKDCCKRLLSNTVHKDVQKLYSGQGRQTSTSKKRNFSETQIFKCLQSFIIQQFPNQKMNLLQYVQG